MVRKIVATLNEALSGSRIASCLLGVGKRKRELAVGGDEMVAEILAEILAAEEASSQELFFGLRALNKAREIGAILPASRVWIDGVGTDERLSGASALNIEAYGRAGIDEATIQKALKALRIYRGDPLCGGGNTHMVLVCSTRMEGGEDLHEGIFESARVLGCWEMPYRAAGGDAR